MKHFQFCFGNDAIKHVLETFSKDRRRKSSAAKALVDPSEAITGEEACALIADNIKKTIELSKEEILRKKNLESAAIDKRVMAETLKRRHEEEQLQPGNQR